MDIPHVHTYMCVCSVCDGAVTYWLVGDGGGGRILELWPKICCHLLLVKQIKGNFLKNGQEPSLHRKRYHRQV